MYTWTYQYTTHTHGPANTLHVYIWTHQYTTHIHRDLPIHYTFPQDLPMHYLHTRTDQYTTHLHTYTLSTRTWTYQYTTHMDQPIHYTYTLYLYIMYCPQTHGPTNILHTWTYCTPPIHAPVRIPHTHVPPNALLINKEISPDTLEQDQGVPLTLVSYRSSFPVMIVISLLFIKFH